MGRRKSRKKPPSKAKDTGLPAIFDCPFCVHTGSVECKIDRKRGEADILCKVCDAKWKTTHVTELSKPCDVFNDWIDSCDAENRGEEYGDEQYEAYGEGQEFENEYPEEEEGSEEQ
eukprot:TRINITY_DN10997_c0_g1_i1.p1 TRINITY_DN10997_c0_g1~~TRINITY_DN10997_c0_g1_i1.p1  ORF type:complete len:134 (-),score=41.10 TRINITY_DN10997_c0_g1_i1:40-387(-)